MNVNNNKKLLYFKKKNSIFQNKKVRKMALVYIFLRIFNVWLNRIQLEFCNHFYVQFVALSHHIIFGKLYCTLVRELEYLANV